MKGLMGTMVVLMLLVVACGPPPTQPPQAAAPSATPESVATPEVAESAFAPTSPTLAPSATARPSPSPTPAARPLPSPSPRPSASPVVAASPSPSPSARPGGSPTPPALAAGQVEPRRPLVVDSEGGRLYLPARVEGAACIAALSAVDGRLLATYPADGPFGLDAAHGWLYVDQGEKGLLVFDVESGAVRATIPLPAATLGSTYRPAPQPAPSARQVLAFRDNTILVVDPEQGGVVHTILTTVTLYNSGILPIAGAAYDSEWAILYLLYHYSPAYGYSFTLLAAYDLAVEAEIARRELPQTDPWSLEMAAAGGVLYGLSRQSFLGANASAWYWTWQAGEPRFTSQDWLGTLVPALQLDAPRQRLYAATVDSLLLLDAPAAALSAAVPHPAEGRLVGYDPATDQLYFLTETWDLEIRPVGALDLPGPEPLAAAQPPARPVRALAAVASGAAETTLLGIWQAGNTPQEAMVLGRTGGLPLLGQAGQEEVTWRQPRGGLRGEAALFSALAASPDYAADGTLLAGTAGLGVWRSTDRGRLWQPASVGLETMRVHEILVGGDGTAFASAPLRPLHRSRTGGRTWQALPLEAYRVALSPEFEDDRTLLAAAGAHPYGEIHLSRDGGDSWEGVGQVPNASPPTALSLAPLFAKWQVAFAYEEAGRLYRTADGGRSWTAVLETGLSPSGAQVVYIPGVEENRPVFLLATPRYDPTYNTATGYMPAEPPDPAGRLYRSGDGGLSWEEVDLPAGARPTALALSPHYEQDGLLWLGTDDGRVLALRPADL